MPLTERQAQSIADELIANAKTESREQRNLKATPPSLAYRYGLPDLAAFDSADQAQLILHAKTHVRRSMAFRVALLSVIIANSTLAIAWFMGLFHVSTGTLLPTTVGWLNLGFLFLLWVVLVRYRIRKMAAKALNKTTLGPRQ